MDLLVKLGLYHLKNMDYLDYKNVKATETGVHLVFAKDSVMVAKKTEDKWRSCHEDFEINSQDIEEIKQECHRLALEYQDQDLNRFYQRIKEIKETLMFTPAFVVEKR